MAVRRLPSGRTMVTVPERFFHPLGGEKSGTTAKGRQREARHSWSWGIVPYDARAFSNTLASIRSGVSKPAVNQP
jgi:hypothetical protein